MFKQSAGDDKDIVKYDLLILTMSLMEHGWPQIYKVLLGNNSVMTLVVYGLIDSDSIFIAYFMSHQYDKYLHEFEQLMNNINLK
jgi:hypothetical protein